MVVERDISGLIAAWGAGDRTGASQFDVCYLSRCPANRTATLRSASGRPNFLALCSQILRRILVDHARSRGYDKRGGNALHVPLDEVLIGARARGIEILALDEALDSLSKIDARQTRVVELRYFGA
jgi:ECF sigma factor